MRIAVVTGNPKPASRTHRVALAVAGTLSAALVPSARSVPMVPPDAASPLPVSLGAPAPLVVDLAEHASVLFDSSDAELTRLSRRGRRLRHRHLRVAHLQGRLYRHAQSVP